MGGHVHDGDPTTNIVSAPISLGGNTEGVAFDGTNIWIALTGLNQVAKLRL